MKVLYLSGAPRLSTKPSTESLGPRSHILGVVNALQFLGADVERFIVGDTVPESVHGAGSEQRMSSSRVRVLAADAVRAAYRIRSRNRLAAAVGGGSYDFVYERYALFQELGSVARARTGAPWILEVNALLAIEATSERRATSSRALALRIEGGTLRSADMIVAVTEALAEQIRSTYGIDRSRILVVQNGVDHTHHTAVSAAGSDDGSVTIGFVGTLYAWQNVGALIEALTLPGFERVRLEVAGDGPERERLAASIARLGLGDRVVLHGRMHPDAVAPFLSTVDLCFAGHGSANGSYFSPLKLWEYLAAGKAVIASEHEATLALAADGYAIRCFGGAQSPSLEDALADAIRDLPALRARAAECQQRVWDEHSWARRVETILDAVERRAKVDA